MKKEIREPETRAPPRAYQARRGRPVANKKPARPTLLTQAEFARRVGVLRQSVYRAIKTGRVRVEVVAGLKLVPVSEVARYKRALEHFGRPRQKPQAGSKTNPGRSRRSKRPG